MEIETLYKQLRKGAQYFNQKYAEGNRTPVIMRQVADFERQVIIPFDLACRKLTPEDRQKLEDEHVPF